MLRFTLALFLSFTGVAYAQDSPTIEASQPTIPALVQSLVEHFTQKR